MDTHSPVRAGLIAVILIMAAALAVLLFNLVPLFAGVEPVQPPLRKVRSSVTSAVSLEDAGGRATGRALAWAPDVIPVRVEGAWYLTSGWEKVNAPPVAWSFYFYSRAENSLACVVIDDDALLWVPPFEIPTEPRELTGYPPAYGADSAWLTFRAAGGDLFLRQHPDAQINFRLQTGAEVPVWTVSAFDEGEYIRVSIDAQTGMVLPSQE